MTDDDFAEVSSWDWIVSLGIGAGMALMVWTCAWFGLTQ